MSLAAVLCLCHPSSWFCYVKHWVNFHLPLQYYPHRTTILPQPWKRQKWHHLHGPWRIFHANASNEPITSPLFSFYGDRWRDIITPQLDIFLQLVFSVKTITVEIRYERVKQSPYFELICLFTYLKPYESFWGLTWLQLFVNAQQ